MNSSNKANLVNWPKEIPIAELYEKFGSPTWIVFERQIISNVDFFEKFTGDKGRIYYPVKTNPSLTVLQILAKLGVGADCASGSEIDLALYAGIKIENISYNTPAQDLEICKRLLLSGAKVVMDDIESIIELQNDLKGTEFEGKLFLRVNLPEFISYAQATANQDLMAHAHKSSKFGIPVEDLETCLAAMHIPVSGLHVHVGTQMDNMASFEFAIQELNNLADRLTALGHPITDINIGGGLGIPFSADDNFPSLDFWSSKLLEFKRHNYQYSVEPGHALVGNTVALLTKVLNIKKSRGKKWVIVDIGTDQLAKITLLKWPHRILDESGEELAKGEDAIAGPLCFAGDTLLEQVSVEKLKKGSPLLIPEVGAYTYSMTNKFNGRLAPKWVLITADNEVLQTMDKETIFDDLQLSIHEWTISPPQNEPIQLDESEINSLSSTYLKTTVAEDQYSFLNVSKLSENLYEFTVLPSSKVSFISMPLAIRIFGDAGIITILHKNGYSQKDFSLWGRKITMDCFGLIRSDRAMKFTISISEQITRDSSKIQVVRFKTSCRKCSGSFIGIY